MSETGHLIPLFYEIERYCLIERYYLTVTQNRIYFRMIVKQLIIKIVLFGIKMFKRLF